MGSETSGRVCPTVIKRAAWLVAGGLLVLTASVCLAGGTEGSGGSKAPRVVILSDFPPLDVIPVGAGQGRPAREVQRPG